MTDNLKSSKGLMHGANEVCYIVIIAVMGVSLLLGFAAETFGIDLGSMDWFTQWATSPVALAIGFVFALIFGETFPVFNKTMSKRLLQYSVIGLGFGQRGYALYHHQRIRHVGSRVGVRTQAVGR